MIERRFWIRAVLKRGFDIFLDHGRENNISRLEKAEN